MLWIKHVQTAPGRGDGGGVTPWQKVAFTDEATGIGRKSRVEKMLG
jgi:hypothetical protein